jgi:hypothetical protein
MNAMPTKTYKHLDGLRVTARFSSCGNFRYLLSIQDPATINGDSVCTIMQNPSVADELRADKSVQFLEKLLFEKRPHPFKRVSELLVVNQFAYIQTHGFRGEEIRVGEKNDHFIQQAVIKATLILVAWGKNNPYTSRQEVVHHMLAAKPQKCLYQTLKHPSRGSYSGFVQPYHPA